MVRVSAPADDTERARHLHRLEYQAWDQGRWSAARDHGRQARLLDPTGADPESVDGIFALASASLGLQDYLDAARVLDGLSTQPPGRLRAQTQIQARGFLDALVPSVQVLQAGSATQRARLQVLGHIGQTYELQTSADLHTWTTVHRQVATGNRYSVEDPVPPVATEPRFYRVLWLP